MGQGGRCYDSSDNTTAAPSQSFPGVAFDVTLSITIPSLSDGASRTPSRIIAQPPAALGDSVLYNRCIIA
jgi:hypothetical protein